MNQDEQIQVQKPLTKQEQIFRKNAFKQKEHIQLQSGNKKLQIYLKDIRKLKSQSVDRIFLNVEELSYQVDKQLSSDDLDKIKEDKKKYLKFLLNRYKSIYPDELLNFNLSNQQKNQQKNLQKKVKTGNGDKQSIRRHVGLEEKGSSAAEENESDNMWDSDFGEMGDHFEESNDQSLGDGGYDDYD